jgi:LuxR family maltose regulon positive regulatory protein
LSGPQKAQIDKRREPDLRAQLITDAAGLSIADRILRLFQGGKRAAMNPSKFLPPRPVRTLERERLAGRLRYWEDKKLVIIHAQAGQGKSTLAAEYVHSLSGPSIWYNTDREDDNPYHSLYCLGQAVQQAFPDYVPRAPILPKNPFSVKLPDAGIRRWVHHLFDNFSRPCLVVFDDFQNASWAQMVPLVTTLLKETPRSVRFMILSRNRPDFAVAGLRAKRAIGELSGADLKFSDEEAYHLFGSVLGMLIRENEAALLNRKAEGWPAGLILMHEYLSAAAPEVRAAVLSGSREHSLHVHVFDYLAQEVFDHLPQELQQFLLRTSISDYLPSPLMERLVYGGRNKSDLKSLVEQLKARNLFITILNDDGTVIRYHSLFRDFLRKKLTALAPAREIKKLHCLAADYFSANGDPVRSVELLLASGQFEKALRKIESSIPDMIARGQTGTILRWQAAVPMKDRDRPWFLFSRAVGCRFTDPRAALAYFDRAFAGFRTAGKAGQTSAQVLCLNGIIEACFYAGGNFKRMGQAAAFAVKLLSRASARFSAPVRARVLLALGTASFFIGNLRRGSDALGEALEIFGKTGDHFFQIQSAIYLAPCSIYQGDFVTARSAVTKGFEALASIPEEKGGEAALFMARAMTALFEGNFAEARQCLDRSQVLAREFGLEAFDFLSLNIGGWLKTAAGEYEQAEELLLRCKRKGAERENIFFATSGAHLLAVNYLHRNKLRKAAEEVHYALSGRQTSGSRLFYAVSRSVSGAISLKQGFRAAALRELRHALRLFREIGAAQEEANVHLILARLHLQEKNKRTAAQALESAFGIGEKQRFTYYYLQTPEELRELASHAADCGIRQNYSEALLREAGSGRREPRLKVRCLGGFEVFQGSSAIKDTQWKSKRSRMLLKLLVAHDGQKLPRERAWEMLWPGQESENLSIMFNSLLHRMRKVLDPGGGKDVFCIRQEGDLIALASDSVWTDVREFLSGADRVGHLRSAGKEQELLEEYERTVQLYKGEFLPEDLYSEWTREIREQLRAVYMRLLTEAGALADAKGEKHRALQFYEKMFLADSCSELACRWLMNHHAAAGQRSEAVRVYERCERALSRDMDLEPEDKTKEIYRSIIGG